MKRTSIGARRMRTLRAAAAALAVLASAWTATAQAARVAGAEGNPERLSNQATTAPRPTTAPAAGLTLAQGVLGAVDSRSMRITINGQMLPLHPSQLRVMSPQGQTLGGAAALRAGMVVRFAQEGAAAAEAERRVVLIYVDRQP